MIIYGNAVLAVDSARPLENVGAIWVSRDVPRVPFRDLFSIKATEADRKGSVAPVANEKKREAKKSQTAPKVVTVPTLIGIVLSDRRQAFFLDGTEHIIVRDNENISRRYRVLKIESDRVFLRDEQTGLERTILAN
ncbi:hypothetical protein [Thiohalomonas denitrificans]|uniref:hypothetical protein n=1 Tax=Thiohalomonas denitrificans TaxID=415747 RepID=UPI0026F28C03|nr:hypothetical protein [Thiohalomonas denitrificans]